ncbi:hypothetical protein [Pseudocolwellia agarivorans]|uniref:hypothetical protein n=1 Tax=Pseudocolwellia agarivorans TaxID=1911682 RepID=UPI000987694C|nr:hypothetical protein [Pseudocolwellia agarivorans]
MKKAFTLLFVLFSVTQSFTAKSDVPSDLNGFKQAINNVHYLAKVKITKVEVSHEDDELEKHVYSADVLATYKGETHKHIRYEMFVEQGEDVVFNSAPVYIALCVDNNATYYWPGTGSEFKYSSAIDSWLTENKTKLNDMKSSAGWCE